MSVRGSSAGLGTTQEPSPFDIVIDLLDALDLDAITLRRTDNFAWFTSGASSVVDETRELGVASILVSRDGAVVVASNIDRARLLEEELFDTPLDVIGYDWYSDEAAVLGRFIPPGRRIGSDTAATGTTDVHAELVRRRTVLSAGALDRYRATAAQATAVVEEVCRQIRPGWTEQQVRGEVCRALLQADLYPAVLLVGADDRIAKFCHPVATDQRIERQVMVVVCARRHGLFANLTRFVHFGPVSREISGRHRDVAVIHAAAVAATLPGRTYAAVFRTIQDTYAEVGARGHWRYHHQGGVTGYAPRELVITPQTPGLVQENQLIAWNPSARGAKAEDTFVVRATGPEVLTRSATWPLADTGNPVVPHHPAVLLL